MKRRIALLSLLAIIITMAACGEKTTRIPSEYGDADFDTSGDIAIQTEYTEYGSDAPEVSYTITNNTAEEYVYGVQYAIEALQEGKWYQVPFPEGQAWIDIGIVLKPNDTNTASFSFSELDCEMTDGTYRLIKEIGGKRYFAQFQVGQSPITAETPFGYKALEKLPKEYPSKTAAENGDVVFALDGIKNDGKLLDFVSKAALGMPAMVRVVMYTDEGDPIITDVVYNSDHKGYYLYRLDNSRDAYGGQNGGITDELYSFLLTDQKSIYFSNWAQWELAKKYDANGIMGLPAVTEQEEIVSLVEKMTAERLVWNNTSCRVFSADGLQNVRLFGGLSYGYEGLASSEMREVSDPDSVAVEIVEVLWLDESSFVLVCTTTGSQYYFDVDGNAAYSSGYGSAYTISDGQLEITK